MTFLDKENTIRIFMDKGDFHFKVLNMFELYHKKQMIMIRSDCRGAGCNGWDQCGESWWVKRKKRKGCIFSEVQMETWECNRAFFHEWLLKTLSGRGNGEAGSDKMPLQWHVPHPKAVSFNRAPLSQTQL